MKVVFWHGYSESNKTIKEMVEKLENIGCYKAKEDDSMVWTYPDALRNFVDKWDEKFLVLKDENNEWVVFVTHYKNFGQR